MSEAVFERLRAVRVSPHKRGADLPASVHGPLTGLVPGASVAAAAFARRRRLGPEIVVRDPAFAARRRALVALPPFEAPPFESRRRVQPAPIVRDPPFVARRMAPGAPVGSIAAVTLEKRWPTCAGTPFEFTAWGAGRAQIAGERRLTFRSEDSMTDQEMLALKGTFVTIEGQRREIRAVHLTGDGSCEFDIHPPIALAAPQEVFEPLAVTGTVTVLADTRVRFVPDK